MVRTVAIATLVAGALDIIYAMILTLVAGREIGAMLRSVASGPIPGASGMGSAGAALGLVTHFVLMSIMAGAFMFAARNYPVLLARPIWAGIAFGVLTYIAMNLIVVPVRFDTPLPLEARRVVSQLFAHIVLVGIPIALIAEKGLRRNGLA